MKALLKNLDITAILQDIAIILAVILALTFSGLHMQWYHVLIICIGLGTYGIRNGYVAFHVGFKRGHDCRESHKPPVHMQIADREEFEKIMAAIKEDYPID